MIIIINKSFFNFNEAEADRKTASQQSSIPTTPIPYQQPQQVFLYPENYTIETDLSHLNSIKNNLTAQFEADLEKSSHDPLNSSQSRREQAALLNQPRTSLGKQRSLSDSRLYVDSGADERSFLKSIPAQKNKQNLPFLTSHYNTGQKTTEPRKYSDGSRYLRSEKRDLRETPRFIQDLSDSKYKYF